jgi:hypothetical protein
MIVGAARVSMSRRVCWAATALLAQPPIGPAAERWARDYFISLKSGRLHIQREPLPQ